MSDDIVTRLRTNDCFEFPSCDDVKQEAADEIERLRAENDGLRIRIYTLIKKIETLAVHGE